MNKKILIERYDDCWVFEVDGERFTWNHDDEDLGTKPIKALLEYLGHTVQIEEVY